ncbi:MAG TPA: tetratricopeptide repeat protein, partial [Burkholderiaceae bacterium]|nr:tetratricopeptide repeat protein [Burkholderiaceae bacterium]
IAPDYVGAYNNLGSVLRDSGRLAEAEANYRQALHIKPDFADAYLNLGNVFKDAHNFIDAEINYRLALQIKPNYAEAYSNLGLALTALRRFPEAETCYRRALELQPDSVEIYTNLGFALVEQHKFSDAEISLRHALKLKPDFSEAYNNLGLALRELRQYPASEASFRRALELDPKFTAANNNLGNLLTAFGRLDEAETCFRRALEVNPNYSEAHLNLALMLLQAGDYARGWKEYEYRWSSADSAPMREFVEPIWLGETSLRDKSILLHAEQGYGDTLQFIRYAQLLADAGATVYAVVPPVLEALVASVPGVTSVFSRFEGLPTFDYHCPLMSLPFALKSQLDTIPATIPYVACSPAKIDQWRQKLNGRVANKTVLRVGLAWAGSPRKDQPAAHLLDRQRSMHFDQFKPLLDVHSIEFFSLQLGAEAQAQLQGNANVVDHTAELHNFDDTAALMANLDLIISVDTAVVHLAGAIGKPVWLLNRYNTCWRWLADREDSPWYPSVRIFRQPEMGDWVSVIHNVRAALAQRLRES